MEKAVLITGVSGGMGLATAKKFIANGYHVFGLDINEPKEEIESLSFIKCDLTKEKEVIDSFNIIKEETKQLELIINTAGTYMLNSLVEISEEEFIKIFNINVFSIYRVNKTFLPLLKEKGKIIMVSSELAPLDPLPFTGIYAVTKKTVEGYAYSLRMELQLLDKQVSVIRPGAVDTSLLDISTARVNSFSEKTKNYKYNAERFKRIVNKVESKKIPPEKIANLAFKIANKKKPKYVYKINRNPLLLLLNAMPQRFQNWVIKKILMSK